MIVALAIVIVLAGTAANLHYLGTVSEEQDATAEVLRLERETLEGWAGRLVAHEARTRPHSARCPTAAECIRNLSTINALTVQLYDQSHEDLTEDEAKAPVGEATAGTRPPAVANLPWVDSL